MKRIAFSLCFLLFLSACNQDSASTAPDREADLEAAAGTIPEGAAEEEWPDPAGNPAAPENSEEALPGAMSTASSVPGTANPLFNYTLQRSQAGAVKIGMTIAQLKQTYGENKLRKVEHRQEGMTTIAYEVLGERGRSDLRVEQECTGDACTVSRITVLHPAFKTTEGIGIGSTFAEVQKSFDVTRVSPGEESFVAIAGNAKMSFLLDLGNIPVERWGKLKVKDVPTDAVVTGVLVY